MPKESKNVDKRCTFSSLVSCYDHLDAVNDKSKTRLVCVAAKCIRSRCLWGSYHTRAARSCGMRPHKQTRSDTISYSTHSYSFHIYTCIW